MSDILQGLNQAQREAVTSTEGFVRVIAGAGSGKTRALAHRFAYLVNDVGILPGNILCVTFTNKASNEMRQRIHNLTGDNDTGYINTFHGFCVSVLQEDSSAVQYPKSFLVLDNSDIDSMYLAGLYTRSDSCPFGEFTILTRPAAKDIAFIHDRMPVIMPENMISRWLSHTEDYRSLLASAAEGVEYSVCG